ncbi:MAG: GTPase HflX, partial [Planctomycetota bacterium]
MELGKRASLLVTTERAVLLGILRDTYEAENPLHELARLTETAGAVVVGKVTQRRQKPEPGTYVGKGKVEELKRVCQEFKANVVICEDDLKPSQLTHLEELTELKVIDRTELILDIFALRALTHQSQLQIELAQAEYSLPRLKRMWKHLERIEGGIGTRGPGEKQIESDRQQIKKKISDLRHQLRKIEEQKEREVIHRNESHYTVALVGYTNSGKSTLMNQLTHADALVENRLFSTISTKT